jgi:hypothetical protein
MSIRFERSAVIQVSPGGTPTLPTLMSDAPKCRTRPPLIHPNAKQAGDAPFVGRRRAVDIDFAELLIEQSFTATNWITP